MTGRPDLVDFEPTGGGDVYSCRQCFGLTTFLHYQMDDLRLRYCPLCETVFDTKIPSDPNHVFICHVEPADFDWTEEEVEKAEEVAMIAEGMLGMRGTA